VRRSHALAEVLESSAGLRRGHPGEGLDFVSNIGENGNGNNPSREIATSTTVYGAIGQALPSPPPETIAEVQQLLLHHRERHLFAQELATS